VNPGFGVAGTDLYRSLSWLPRPPADFVARCRALEPDPAPGPGLQALAVYALDENDLHRLSALITGARHAGKSLSPLVPFRLGILSNATTDFIVPALIAIPWRDGIAF